MSGEVDKDGKTEAPTEKRQTEAVEKGNTPFSREAVALGSLLGVLAGVTGVLPGLAASLTREMRSIFAQASQLELREPVDATAMLTDVAHTTLLAVAPFLVVVAIGGMLGALLQNAPSARSERIKPKFERLSPVQNLKRILGKEGVIEFLKSLAKLIALVVVAYAVLKVAIFDLAIVSLGDPTNIFEMLRDSAVELLVATAVLVFLLAVVDVVWTRLRWWKGLMMTRQELKDEFKNTEGDPMLKQRRKQIAQKRLRTRMMVDMPKATVVVVNPTHFAVALRYVQEEGGAPLVIAKGLDSLALKIREASSEHGIPLVENKPLARSLYGACEVGEMIPAEYFRAVAEVILFVDQRRRLARNQGKPGARTQL